MPLFRTYSLKTSTKTDQTSNRDTVPFSVKAAITAGAVVGGTIALVNNREKLLELGEQLFQNGADFCRNKLKEHKQGVLFAADIHDGEYEEYETDTDAEDVFEDEFDPETDFLDSEVSTPNTTDAEWEHDLDVDSLD